MAAILFLLLCFVAGYSLLALGFPTLLAAEHFGLRGRPVAIYRPFLILPAAFCLGYISLCWAAYLGAYAARQTGHAMAFGAWTAFVAGAALVLLGGLLGRFRGLTDLFRGFGRWQAFALVFGLAAGCFISFFSFWEDETAVSMAVNVFSDFSPHIAVIRSFSQGSNFPTQYPHFADGTIRYHFLFLFGAGLLEFLGLPLTVAFNLPSLLSFLSLTLLLFTLAHILTGSRGAAALSLCLFFFRSSWAFFTFLGQRPEDVGLWDWLLHNQTFIGSTLHEDWGLFNQNVWANQRHLALGMSLVLLAILYFLPLFLQGFAALARAEKGQRLRVFLFDPEGWTPVRSHFWGLPLGLLLGAAAFWHGSMVISALMILAGMGIFSRHRLTYLFTALPAAALSSLQSAFFTGGASPLQLQLHFGFLAPSGSLPDVARYIFLLTGVFFLLLTAALCWAGGPRREGDALGRAPAVVFFLCCLLPFVQAFTLMVTSDVAVSHKQVMLSLILDGILLAWLLTALWQRRDALRLPRRLAAAALIFLLTVTGVEDAVTYANCCRSGAVQIPKQSALTDWIREETPTGSVFITGYITIHPVFTAGRLTYQGWPYYAWSAGYDTFGRDEALMELFQWTTPDDFAHKARALGADYILVDESLTEDERFAAFFADGGEGLLAQALPLVYRDETTRIYAIP